MSGLNNDIEEDIEQELPGSDKLEITPDQFKTLDNDLAKPGENQPKAPSIVLKVGDDTLDADGKSITPTAGELFGEDVVPNELPDLDAKILLVESNKNTIDDAVSALNTIVVNKSISQENIKEIDAILPGYLGENERIEYYTKTPTQTRYKAALETISNQISFQQDKQTLIVTQAFDLLKVCVDKTKFYLNESLIKNNDSKKEFLLKALKEVEDTVENKVNNTSPYYENIKNLLFSDIGASVVNFEDQINTLVQRVVYLIKKPTALSTFLNKIIFLKEDIDQDYVFYSLSSPDNLTQEITNATLKKLMIYAHSTEKLKLVGLMDCVLSSAIVYADDTLASIKDSNTSKAQSQPGPLTILKREAQAINAINVLITDIVELDKTLLTLVIELEKLINAIPATN